jgi:hypothetical protein
LYIGASRKGQKAQDPVDLAAHRVLYIGPAQGTNFIDSPSTHRVLYIGLLMSTIAPALDAGAVVGFHVVGMFLSISAQISRMVRQPIARLGIASFKHIRVGRHIPGLRLLASASSTDFSVASFLDGGGSRIGMILVTAIQTRSGGSHRRTSTHTAVPNCAINQYFPGKLKPAISGEFLRPTQWDYNTG